MLLNIELCKITSFKRAKICFDVCLSFSYSYGLINNYSIIFEGMLIGGRETRSAKISTTRSGQAKGTITFNYHIKQFFYSKLLEFLSLTVFYSNQFIAKLLLS